MARLPRATCGTIGRFQAQTFGNLFLPVRSAEGAASLYALSQRLQLLFVVRLVDARNPVWRCTDWPRCQQRSLVRRAVTPSPQARPPPLLCPQHKIRANSISLAFAASRVTCCYISTYEKPSRRNSMQHRCGAVHRRPAAIPDTSQAPARPSSRDLPFLSSALRLDPCVFRAESGAR